VNIQQICGNQIPSWELRRFSAHGKKKKPTKNHFGVLCARLLSRGIAAGTTPVILEIVLMATINYYQTIRANFCPNCHSLLELPSSKGVVSCVVCSYSSHVQGTVFDKSIELAPERLPIACYEVSLLVLSHRLMRVIITGCWRHTCVLLGFFQ
jgi:hypothetical protein